MFLFCTYCNFISLFTQAESEKNTTKTETKKVPWLVLLFAATQYFSLTVRTCHKIKKKLRRVKCEMIGMTRPNTNMQLFHVAEHEYEYYNWYAKKWTFGDRLKTPQSQ